MITILLSFIWRFIKVFVVVSSTMFVVQTNELGYSYIKTFSIFMTSQFGIKEDTTEVLIVTIILSTIITIIMSLRFSSQVVCKDGDMTIKPAHINLANSVLAALHNPIVAKLVDDKLKLYVTEKKIPLTDYVKEKKFTKDQKIPDLPKPEVPKFSEHREFDI